MGKRLTSPSKEVLPSIFGGARLGSGFSVAGEYYSLNRDTTVTLARNITVEDVNIGIGLMYRHVDYRLDVEKERIFGRFASEFSGPAVFLEAGF